MADSAWPDGPLMAGTVSVVIGGSPLSSFVTGADLRVDGGLLASVGVPGPAASDTRS